MTTTAHPAWCDRERCAVHGTTGDVTHLSAVQSVEVDDGWDSQIRFWLSRHDERLRGGDLDTGVVDVEMELVGAFAIGRPPWLALDSRALGGLGRVVTDLQRQAPEMVTYADWGAEP